MVKLVLIFIQILYNTFLKLRISAIISHAVKFKLRKGKAPVKHILRGETTASVLLKLFISGNKRCPLAHERSYCQMLTTYNP